MEGIHGIEYLDGTDDSAMEDLVASLVETYDEKEQRAVRDELY